MSRDDTDTIHEHALVLHETLAQVYNGAPLAVVEVWPSKGETVEACEREWTVRRSRGAEGITVVSGDGDQATICGTGAQRNGLSWHRPGSPLTSGWALFLLTPREAPGARRWLLDYMDQRRPDLTLVEAIRQVILSGVVPPDNSTPVFAGRLDL